MSEQRHMPYWRKKSDLIAHAATSRLVLLDGLKNWIETPKCLNCVTRGWRRLTLALELASQDERCSGG